MFESIENFVQGLPPSEALAARQCLERIAEQGLLEDLFEQFTTQLQQYLSPQTIVG